jgi:glycogen debranching enzyme
MSDNVSILEGDTFVVSDRCGNVDASPTDPQGLFRDDTRFLSRWILTVDGNRPGILSVDDLSYFSAQFFLTPTSSSVYANSTVAVLRRREVADGFREEITIENSGADPVDMDVRIEAASDFADLFEVKDALAKKGEHYGRVDGQRLVLGYRRGTFVRETAISASADEARFDDHGISFHVRIPAHAAWRTELRVVAEGARRRPAGPAHGHDADGMPSLGEELERWIAQAPRLVSSWSELPRIYHRCLVDLAALRFTPVVVPGALPAAGLPWFMAVFGRDSVLTSLQALPFAPELAKTTLRMLALLQGSQIDDFRDEEPGKILHELRLGEMTAFEERPHSPYYGAADSTPLFLVLLDEYERWSGDSALVRELESVARYALAWIDLYGDRDGDGYVEYARRNQQTGLENQCWKDSWDAIRFADGAFAEPPRATCEIQGYVYDAKVRSARLAREIWNDPTLADRLEREAAELRRRFNEDFWIPDRGYFALALDGKKRKVDSLTSNIGHLLWSGIVDDDKAKAVAEHLIGERLFSGWGVRTMAQGDGAYNPIGYHVGTVWPHDTAIVAQGLHLYGFHEAAARIARGILEAAVFFDGRLPEAFAGFHHRHTNYPVEYPTACSPQAWATGTPFLLLRILLGLRPIGDNLLVAPSIPTSIERIELLGIPGRWGRADAFGRGTIDIGDGLH